MQMSRHLRNHSLRIVFRIPDHPESFYGECTLDHIVYPAGGMEHVRTALLLAAVQTRQAEPVRTVDDHVDADAVPDTFYLADLVPADGADTGGCIGCGGAEKARTILRYRCRTDRAGTAHRVQHIHDNAKKDRGIERPEDTGGGEQ